MAVHPQVIHRSGAGNPRIFHRFDRILYTAPAELSTENQELSTRRRAHSVGCPQFVHRLIHGLRYFSPRIIYMKNLLRLEEFFLYGLALFLFTQLDYGWG